MWHYAVTDEAIESTLKLSPDYQYLVFGTDQRIIILSTVDGSVFNTYEMTDFLIKSTFADESIALVTGSLLSNPYFVLLGAFY